MESAHEARFDFSHAYHLALFDVPIYLVDRILNSQKGKTQTKKLIWPPERQSYCKCVESLRLIPKQASVLVVGLSFLIDGEDAASP